MELLNAQPSAITLLDTSRRVIYTNASADALRASADGIIFSRAGLSLLDPREDALFQSLITQAIAGDAGETASRTRAMRAARPSGRRAFGILVTAVGRSYSALSPVRPAACVIVTDPEAHSSRRTTYSVRCLGLPPQRQRWPHGSLPATISSQQPIASASRTALRAPGSPTSSRRPIRAARAN